ncbi:MAG: undecaprenyldiphospho-muramoylpentapeptide beta-N-acetylglucosaminyltransferase [Endomicrobia bacterium]|nr:undecaprenyldiphospho-muramoylpentapeptide beta-N-acetylglucosaminyltransferase [Endomicrobiia bacterium]MCL2799127.1 undecaprenyldiphospho-muramoylpentapeptide beta-N-acetylglucosaminyltransferase [Endomicrobiia bacterium]
MENKNIIIAASGTGGHIYPGISLAHEFKDNGYHVTFFISNNIASVNIMKNSGFEYVTFNLSGMPRGFSIRIFSFAFKLVYSFFKSFKLIFKIKPLAVIGTGGYISVPTVAAAKILRIKTFIHEQNSLPGAANKLLSRIADKTFISFKHSKKYFNKNTFFSGYPVRKDIFSVSKEDALRRFDFKNDVFTLLVFGGSLGALKINEIAFEAVKELSLKEQLQVLHITGGRGYSDIKDRVRYYSWYKVFDYMHDIKYAYAASDAVVCRSGAGTVFELKMLNKPAVLVPYPHATDNHQFYNAKEKENDGKTEILEENDFTPLRLLKSIKKLKSDLKRGEDIPTEQFAQEIIFGEIAKCIKS